MLIKLKLNDTLVISKSQASDEKCKAVMPLVVLISTFTLAFNNIVTISAFFRIVATCNAVPPLPTIGDSKSTHPQSMIFSSKSSSPS